jgi:hypothetical protein
MANGPLEERWNVTFYEKDDNYISDIISLPSGGYVVVGQTGVCGSSSDSDAFLYKLNSNGETVLTTFFGGNQEDWFSTVINDGDQGLIAIGNTVSSGSGRLAPWIFKLDTNGNEIWNKTLYNGSFMLGSGVKTSDGNFVIVGTNTPFRSAAGMSHMALLLKADSEGNELWTKSYGSGGRVFIDGISSFRETCDGDYIMAGYTQSYSISNMPDGWLLKTDSEGNELWNHSFGDLDIDWLLSAFPCNDGGYIAIGKTRPYGTPYYNAWIVKTDKDGNNLWEKRYFQSYDSSFYSMIATSDGNFIAVGSMGSVPDGSVKSTFGVDHYQGIMMKFDENGNELWNQTFKSYESSSFESVIQANNNYVVAGYAISEGCDDKDALVVLFSDPEIQEDIIEEFTENETTVDKSTEESVSTAEKSPLSFTVTLVSIGLSFIALKRRL